MIIFLFILYGLIASIMDFLYKKFADTSNRFYLIIGIIAAIIANISWLCILKSNIKLSIGVGISVLVNLIIATIIGIFILNEKLNRMEMIGLVFAIIAIIFLGIKK